MVVSRMSGGFLGGSWKRRMVAFDVDTA